VVLFATRGYRNHLLDLVSDILAGDQIPFINSYDACSSDEPRNFIPDGHFVHECDRAIAAKALVLVDRGLGRH
jgi:hypothetical protein